MNGIEFFNNSNEETHNHDLPWVREWSKKQLDPAKPKEVLFVYPGDKGLLLLTGDYKAFVRTNEAVYKYLVEALETWVKECTVVSPLVSVANTKGRFLLGLDHDGKKVSWRNNDRAYESVRLDEPIKTETNGTNPFLQQPNSPVRTVDAETSKRKRPATAN